ncbi:MAG: hypothetical protein V7642_2173 [Burkholderiales bacterium]|jgi:hypothetical protein
MRMYKSSTFVPVTAAERFALARVIVPQDRLMLRGKNVPAANCAVNELLLPQPAAR